MGNRKFIHFLLIACLFVSLFYGIVLAETKPISSGASFPDLTFKETLSKKEQAYLGIYKKARFSFKEIPGALFLFEVFSTYCFICPENVPILNNVYTRIENDPKLKGKVKVIGIAVGNNRNEIESFKKEYKVLYPLFTDPDFDAHRALGNPRVPYTIFVRRDDARRKSIVVKTHQGKADSVERVIDDIRNFLHCDPITPACEFTLK